MKYLIKLSSIILLLLSFPTHAQKEGFFTGAALGYSKYGGVDESEASRAAGFDLDVDTSGHLGWKLFAGYNINKYFGVEAGYLDLGKIATFQTFLGNVRGAGPSSVDVDLKRKGFLFYGVLNYPVADRVGIFAKLGGFAANTKISSSIDGIAIDSLDLEDDDFSTAFGLGAKYTFENNLGLRAEWEGHLIEGSESSNFFSISIIYHF